MAAEQSAPLIEMRGIRKSYYIGQPNELEILHGIDLCVYPGEFVTIVGESGSGKSTLMNIMTVSVTERTREIGTRKALGAPAGAIRMQFITESMVLCLFGGAIGVALGVSLGTMLAGLIGFEARPSLQAILVAFGFSMAIGVFFGYYPANKAARLDPIEALRYE